MVWTNATLALLISPALLCADSTLSVGYSVDGPGSCGSSFSSTANSERLDIGSCVPAALTNPAAWVSATANPFSVALAGYPGYIPAFDSGVKIFGSAEWDGAFEVTGGSGSAYFDFLLRVQGAGETIAPLLTVPALGFAVSPNDPWFQFYSLPVSFGVPYAYTMYLANSVGPFDSNGENIAMTVDDITIVDASGAPIAGASLAEVPEPHAVWLLGVAALLALPGLGRRLKSRDHRV